MSDVQSNHSYKALYVFKVAQEWNTMNYSEHQFGYFMHYFARTHVPYQYWKISLLKS